MIKHQQDSAKNKSSKTVQTFLVLLWPQRSNLACYVKGYFQGSYNGPNLAKFLDYHLIFQAAYYRGHSTIVMAMWSSLTKIFAMKYTHEKPWKLPILYSSNIDLLIDSIHPSLLLNLFSMFSVWNTEFRLLCKLYLLSKVEFVCFNFLD